MTRRIVTATAAFGAALLTAGVAAGSGVTAYTNPGTFHALGVIGQTTNFLGFPEAVATDIGGFYFDRDLTFYGGDLRVFGKNDAPFNPQQNALVDNFLGFNDGIGANVDLPGYNLLSLNIGNLQGARGFTLTLGYFDGFGANFTAFDETTIRSDLGFQFYGFALPSGEYFTGFKIDADNTAQDFISGTPTAPALAQVELGYQRAHDGGPGVPEPAAWALMLLGFSAAGAVLRRRGGRRGA